MKIRTILLSCLIFTSCAGKKYKNIENQIQKHEKDIIEIYQSLLKLDKALFELRALISENKSNENNERLQIQFEALKEDSERLKREIENKERNQRDAELKKEQNERDTELKKELANINKKLDEKPKTVCPVKNTKPVEMARAPQPRNQLPANIAQPQKPKKKRKPIVQGKTIPSLADCLPPPPM